MITVCIPRRIPSNLNDTESNLNETFQKPVYHNVNVIVFQQYLCRYYKKLFQSFQQMYVRIKIKNIKIICVDIHLLIAILIAIFLCIASRKMAVNHFSYVASIFHILNFKRFLSPTNGMVKTKTYVESKNNFNTNFRILKRK